MVEGEVLWRADEEGFEVAGEGVEEEVAEGVISSDEEGFAVVAELQFRPIARGAVCRHRRGHDGWELVEGAEVEGREGGFIVVSQIVEEDGAGGGGGNCENCSGGVVSREGGGREVEAALRVGRGERPETDRVI